MTIKKDITDLNYKMMSQIAYLKVQEGQEIDIPGWQVLDQKHNVSGMDAVTFYNPETKQAVNAFRGTEGDAIPARSVPDFRTDLLHIGIPEIKATIGRAIDWKPKFWTDFSCGVEDGLGITKLNDWAGDIRKSIDKNVGSFNQLYEAENYVNSMKDQHKDLQFSLTGHSLGGANAQYAAVYTGLNAVTFSAPTVAASLTPEMRRKAEEGAFDGQETNFIHPGDGIASGFLDGYERHVGSTFLIDSNYEDANKNYGMNMWGKIKDTFFDDGPKYHDMKHYKFDENGYIVNSLYDEVTGERVLFSPRKPSDHNLKG